MKKPFIFFLYFLCCVSHSYANSYGKIGVGISSDILPNFVNLIFGANGVSKATEAEMKQAEEELALSLQHARTFIADRYSKYGPFNASIEASKKELSKAEDDIEMASYWETMSDDEKYEYAKKRLIETNPKLKYTDEREYRGIIYIEIKKLNVDFSENTLNANKLAVKRVTGELEKLKKSTNNSLDEIMRLIELSPETVHYFYSKYCSIIMRQRELKRPTLPVEIEDYMRELETYGVIRDQSCAVAIKKKKVNELALSLARQRNYQKWAESQSVVNLFNSIFLNGYAYYSDYNGAKGSTTKYAQINVNRHLGSIVDVLFDSGGNDFATLVNITTVLQAQTVKKVIAELFKMHSISGEMRNLDFIASPSSNVLYDAKRKLLESENELKNKYGITRIYAQYKPRALYLELIMLSLECDKIVKQSLINNIRNEEMADKLYNSKVKEILGNTVKANGAYYYNF